MIEKVLTIAGSDCSGGAGIQADIKTITVHGQYAMSVITALTAQNTTGVYGVMEATPQFVAQQLDCIFTDIFPDAVKIGMVSSAAIIDVIVDKLIQYKARNIVVDPVMVSTSGSRLLGGEAMHALMHRLLPMGTVITPNLHEAQVLCGMDVSNTGDMLKAAQMLGERLPCAVLIKGGHLQGEARDLLYDRGQAHWFSAPRAANPNTHGTGCTLSSAIACNLAAGHSLLSSIQNAKDYITKALNKDFDLGAGSGPLWHNHAIKQQS